MSRETYFEIGARVVFVRPPPSPSREFLGFRKRSRSRKYVHTTTTRSFPPEPEEDGEEEEQAVQWATYVVSPFTDTYHLLPRTILFSLKLQFVLICFLSDAVTLLQLL